MTSTIQWHDVNKELPDEVITVLVAYPSGVVGCAYYTCGVWWELQWDDCIPAVASWAYLPDAPTKEKP